MYYFYVLENPEGKLYFGSTNDLKRRLNEHQNDTVFSTKERQFERIYYEAYKVEANAREREQQIKYFGQACAQLKRRISSSRQYKS